MKRRNLKGKRFGRLLVINEVEKYRWECLCDCGKKTIVRSCGLTSGHTRSCGCLWRKAGGESRTRLHRIWAHMKSRCNNPGSHAYFRYGARGIKVCKAWAESFMVFRTWALTNGYEENLTIDRIKSNKGYNPMNCQWITRRENCKKGGEGSHKKRDVYLKTI